MNLEITIPEDWKDITYSQYMKYYNATRPYEGTEEVARISLESGALYFCNVPAELLYSIPKDTFDLISERLATMYLSSHNCPLVNQFNIGDVTYGFIPSLDDMTYGEYLDLTNYTQDKFWNNIPIIFSILYRPIDKKSGKHYTIESYAGTNDERIQFFKEILTMDIVFGGLSFFLNLQSDLLIATLHYLEKNLEKMKDPQISQLLETLVKNGVDTQHLQSFLTTTYQNLILLRSLPSTNALLS
jgi:hypothetical protein